MPHCCYLNYFTSHNSAIFKITSIYILIFILIPVLVLVLVPIRIPILTLIILIILTHILTLFLFLFLLISLFFYFISLRSDVGSVLSFSSSSSANFADLPRQHVLTVRMDVPEPWNVQATDAVQVSQ